MARSMAHRLSTTPEVEPGLVTWSCTLLQSITDRLRKNARYGSRRSSLNDFQKVAAKKLAIHSRCPSPSMSTADSPDRVELITRRTL